MQVTEFLILVKVVVSFVAILAVVRYFSNLEKQIKMLTDVQKETIKILKEYFETIQK